MNEKEKKEVEEVIEWNTPKHPVGPGEEIEPLVPFFSESDEK